ncbi:hypothetical protein HPB52_011289 [Rhipicephalus sanguineus]|uniref:Uncharacterized protein n=1 Tax=Rhipicephalus sanguineus TaxID=34632 RepID=A0A9D4Q8V3_RHISA|nr:hypothetical protein HPB52_011289 [Rhipicephalus sanguineus]
MGLNRQVSYSVLSDWANDVFSLNPQTGVFTLTSHLDYEQHQHYVLVVQAQDSGTPSLSSTATVYMNVMDLNDNAPLFDPMSYSDEVFENVTVGSSLLRVSATDLDSGDNGRIVYSIVEGDPDGHLAIEANGTIITRMPLDREKKSMYGLTVRATDQAVEVHRRLSSSVQVTIVLKDVNDMVPEFVTPNVTSVQENAPANSIVMAVKAVDSDEGRNSYVEYSLSPEHSFSLGPVDGLLRVKGPLDREQRASYELLVTARDRGHPVRSASQRLRVILLDENDNSPVFDPRQYSAAVSENASLGTSVLQVSATDQDEGASGQVRYSIIAGDPNHDFEVGQDTGVLRVRRALDYERRTRYLLTVQAEDCAGAGGTELRFDTATVTIAVTDVNDNAPAFVDSPYELHVVENAATPVVLLTLSAHDADHVPSGPLYYRLEESTQGLFRVNSSTGELFLVHSLDREVKDRYQLTVLAVDSGSPRQTGTGTVNVLVSDINDNAPWFERSRYTVTLPENQPVNTPLATITATDADTGRNALIRLFLCDFRYSLRGENASQFRVDPDNGIITAQAPMDHEECERYVLQLVAEDHGLTQRHTAATEIIVLVTDENDNRPVFNKNNMTVVIPDTSDTGHFVLGAQARDLDSGANGRLIFHLSGADAEKFQINQETGIVRLAKKLPAGLKKDVTYHFHIHATDQGKVPLSSSASVRVFIASSSLFPKFQPGTVSRLTLSEGGIGSKGQVLTTISATSPKVGPAARINYYIAGGNNGGALVLNPTTGDLRVVRGEVLDLETMPRMQLWLAAGDSDDPMLSSATRIDIELTDVNDNVPEFDQDLYNTSVREEQLPGQLVAKLYARDADSDKNGRVRYKLRPMTAKESSPSLPFELNANTGELRTTARLDREQMSSYQFLVEASDHGSPSLTGTATVIVTVTDKNDNPPRFTRLFSVNVTENAPIGSFVIQVTSSDRDAAENANATYSFTENPGERFAIDPYSGNVTVAGLLDRELHEEYLLKVAAVDGSWKAETPLTISLHDMNDNAPRFLQPVYRFRLAELQQAGAFIGHVSAMDADKAGPNAAVTYALRHPSDFFRLDPTSGNLLIAKPLPRYQGQKFVLKVKATDQGVPPKTADAVVSIIITSENQFNPVFSALSYQIIIPENEPVGSELLTVSATDADREFNATAFEAYVPENELVGTVVTQLTATDADSGRNKLIQYALVGSSDFAIDSQTGLVTTKTTFDYEQASEYILEVVASNPGSLQYSSCQLRVHITGKNEFYPRFVQPVFQFAVSESTAVGTAVGRVLATDEDSGPDGHVYFLFVGSSNDRGFRIQPSTGIITVARVLDREAQARVVLSVMAKNAGSIRGNDTDEAQVVVSIQDGNDPPMFLQPLYEARISEAAPVGSSVLTVSAVDRDVRPNNHQFFYSIVDGDPNKAFSVDAQTGLLQTSMPLDRETAPVYSLTVAAIDHGSPPQTGTTVVRVTLDDVNDNGPELEPADLLGYVLEDEPPYTSVITLSARDPDLAPNGAPFMYTLVGGARKSLFELDRDTGLLRTTQRLDREATPSIQLLVEVQDSGTPPMRARHTLTIMLVDKNDSPSAPRLVTVMVWVYQNLYPGGKIADVRPLDPDTTGEYQCRLQGRDTIFSIVSHCDLHATRLLSPSNYSLTVRGNDGYHQDVTSTVNVQFKGFDNATVENSISLNIVNQSAHDFLSSTYDRFLGLLGHVLEGLGVPVIYSMTDVQGQLQLALAVKRSSGALVTPEKVVRRLEAKKDSLQGMLAKTILVGYEPCVSSPCQHGGTCHSYLDLQPSLLILDSPQLVFVSPRASRSFACSCPSGFSGDQCQDQLDPCSPNPCADGAPCHPDIEAGFRCMCPPNRQGPRCESQRQESCSSSPCKNGGSCREAPGGSFFCLCRLGFKGSLCEQAADGCRPSRCRNGGTCISDGPAGYHCQCEPNYFGKHCEKSTYGFQPYSFMAFPSLKPSTNDISIVFSTNQRDALLAYNFGVQNGGRSDFVALEIVDGKAQFSFGGSRTAISKVSVDKEVADGGWHRVTVIRNGRVASLSVVSCQDHGEFCEECSHANSSCSLSVTGQAGTLSLSSQPLFVGGLPSVEPLLERPSQVSADDFVGCMHSVSVDGHPLALDAPLRSQYTTVACGRRGDPCAGGCKGGAPCHDLWFTSRCTCSGGGLLAHDCNEALEPYSLGSGSYLELVPQEKHRRAALLLQQSRRSVRSAASFKTMAFRLRTRTDAGLLLQVATERDYTRLQLVDGHLEYVSRTKQQDPVRWRHPRRISDGNWHDITLSRKLESSGAVMLAVEDVEHQIPADGGLHDFLDPFLSSFTIGGHWDLNSVTHENPPGSFQGCIQQIAVNGELQSLNASHNYFQLVVRGTVGRSCNQEALGLDVAADPLGVGIILVIAFFVVLILVILVSLLVFRRCKLKRPKAATSSTQAKSNGCSVINQLTDATRAPPHQEPNYTEPAMPSAPEEHPRSTPSAPELVLPKRTREREGSADLQQVRAPQRPDIIEREALHASSPLAGPRCPEQPAYSSAEPEHYDLENASSIAPSDIDVVYHYRVFRDGSQLRKLHKGVHKHPGTHRHSPASPKARHSPRQQLLLRPAARDSPSALKMHSTPLARLSPSSELSRQTPRILTLQDISGKPLQTALLASAHPGGGSKPFKDPLTNSERSLNSPPSSKQACAPAAESHCSQPLAGLGLTAEEIECLNARPRNSSLVSTLDAVSSSGSEGTKDKLSQLLEDRPTTTTLLDAAAVHDSSSDESGNDSFTCSEFEYDNGYDKAHHRDFGPGNMIFSKLAEEDNENDEDPSKTYDGFDSFRGSLSTLVASDDDLSHLSYKPPSGAVLGWDCLLNWGPNFENLVGVFKDIADLPDTVSPLTPGHPKPNEEYV